jgi:hypothetical protein
MRGIVKTAAVIVAALMGTALLAVTTTFTAAVTLTATTALIVPGTGTPNPAQDYMDNAVNYYLVPAGDCVGGCTTVPVPYYAQFWPIPLPGWGGLEGQKWNVSVGQGLDHLTTEYGNAVDNNPPSTPITIFGYSQGATVATLFKATLHDPANADELNFLFIGDPQRPNGGFFERFAILGTVPILDATFGRPAPTDNCEHSNGSPCATDVALQYDGVVDFPEYPIDFLSTLNAIAGFQYVHGTYLAPNGDDAVTETPYGYTPAQVEAAVAAASDDCSAATFCQRHGDTIYVTLPAKVLPIMQPALDLASATGTSALVIPIVDLISPATQTLIELGYNRTDYGAPTPIRLIPRINPITLTADLIKDIPEGIQAAADPGLTPLPGSDSSASITTLSDPVAPTPGPTSTTPKRRPLTPLNLVARPKLLLVAGKPGQVGSTTLAQPFGTNVHPVRDVARAVAGAAQSAANSAAAAVKKVLGKDKPADAS